MSPALAHRVRLAERFEEERRRWLALGRQSRTDHWRRLLSKAFADTQEALDAHAAAVGVELRDPFLDRRLVELCLALPADQKLRHGWTRVAMRHAMRPLLPDAIVRRRGKTDLSWTVALSLANFGRERVDATLRAAPEILEPYVDGAAVRRLHDRYRSHGTRQDGFDVWRVVTLALRLRRMGRAPAGAPTS